MAGRWRLRSLATLWVIAAFGVGILSAGLWLKSLQDWQTHLDRAYTYGIETLYALETGQSLPDVAITPLSMQDRQRAEAGQFDRLDQVPKPAYVTVLSLNRNTDPASAGPTVKIAVVSDQLQYKVADIAAGPLTAPALKFGELTRLLATFCNDPIVFASLQEGQWWRIDGTAVWGCAATPRDYRLIAAVLLIVALAVLITQIGNTTEAFESFSSKLRSRARIGGPDSYETAGPHELSEIVETVNAYLEAERQQLSKRAIVLSGVSHDLGTPATRLRLRAALIGDPDLREKLESDIDQMTDIIESVLTYTRSELNSETPRRLSLTSLVDAICADYQDTGRPVSLVAADPVEIKAERSVFAPRAGRVSVGDTTKILMFARPVALRRAISNLIDNALKYGRRAAVSVEANADWAVITVEDEGGGSSAADMETLMEPFERGENTQNVSGFGLGLTIVATVARQHGGRIEFEDGRSGVRARLWLRRS